MMKLAHVQKYNRRGLLRRGCLTAIGLSAMIAMTAPVQAASEQQDLVNKAQATIEEFKIHPDMTWFRDHLDDAKAVMVIPVLLKGGFIFGGSGGHGVLSVRGDSDHDWSYPAFNFMGSVTFGLQIGGEASQVVLLVMTDKGVNAMLSTEFKLGVDVSVAVGPVGAGAAAQTADVLAFSRDKGLFGGLTIEGGVVEPRDEWNQAYYGRVVTPVEILIKHEVSNPGAEGLRVALGGPQPAAVTTYNIATIQQALAGKGYDPGAVDGLMGSKTSAAIKAYQAAMGLEATGQPSAALQEQLLSAQ